MLEGLAPGEKVAAAGAFLIDAESRLNPARRPGSAGESAPPKATATDTAPRSAAASTEGVHRH